MVVFPNIKINLGLFVTGKRPDGYHNIESVFYPVGWKESLEVCDRDPEAWESKALVSRAEVGKARFMSYGLPIPGNPSDNLCIKVYQRLEEWFNLPYVDIHLYKSLPIGAGLGGGSADAAYALRAFKEFFELTISDAEALDILASIGSDCPFFWKNRPMFVHGRGDRMHPIDLDLSDFSVALINPGIHFSTKEAYAGVVPSPPPVDLNLITSLEVEDWKEVVFNDFEKSLFPKYPILSEIKQQLYSQGALYAAMTGSGSTIYGIFKKLPALPEEWEKYEQWQGALTL